jgi:hypothetical protein
MRGRNRGISLVQVIVELNGFLIGWVEPKVALVFFRMAAGQGSPTQKVTVVVVKPDSSEETLHWDLADVVVAGPDMDGQSVAVTLNFRSSFSSGRPNPLHAPTGWDMPYAPK